MFNKLTVVVFTFSVLFVISCSVKEDPINYGHDECDYCQMTIVDNKYGAEIVNKQGKAFKFDAAECMLRYIIHGEISEPDIALTFVTDLTKPGKFVDAQKSFYLISDKLPSPMGAYLSSFEDKKTASEYHDKHGGELYSWNELKNYFKSITKTHHH
jgi:copper chaperone NosL